MTFTSAAVLASRLQARARIRHLQLLVLLNELGSLKRAAEAMHLSQPAATQLLADLEALLDMALFERLARGVRPTPAGQALIPMAQRVLQAVADSSETVSMLQREGEGRVRMAAIAGAIAGVLVKALPAFAEAHPRIQISVLETDAAGWSDLLARAEVDLVACRRPVVLPSGQRFVEVLHDRYVIACHQRYRASLLRHTSWQHWARETWLPSPLGSLARATLDSVQERQGLTFDQHPVMARVSGLTWALLEARRLVTLVPYSVVRQLVQVGQLAAFEPPEPLPFEPIGLLLPLERVGLATATLADFVAAHDWADPAPRPARPRSPQASRLRNRS